MIEVSVTPFVAVQCQECHNEYTHFDVQDEEAITRRTVMDLMYLFADSVSGGNHGRCLRHRKSVTNRAVIVTELAVVHLSIIVETHPLGRASSHVLEMANLSSEVVLSKHHVWSGTYAAAMTLVDIPVQ